MIEMIEMIGDNGHSLTLSVSRTGFYHSLTTQSRPEPIENESFIGKAIRTLFHSGVSPDNTLAKSARFMLITSLVCTRIL